MQWEGAEVSLRYNRLCKVVTQVGSFRRKPNAVSAQFAHQILSEDDNLVGTELYSAGVGAELGIGYPASDV